MSPVKELCQQYEAAISNLKAAVDNFVDDLRNLRTAASLDSYYGSNAGDSSSGRVVSEFEAALDREAGTLDLLIGPNGYWQDVFLQMNGKLNILRDRKRQLDGLSANEDRTGKEYTYSDIPF